ncbi:MAG: alpha/beta hydrolase [Henriciella sp.]|nr:alpha/beta hydrolase [Henriciella sp.]
MSLKQRYFEMLGAAYEVPASTNQFDGFLDAAMAYFFDGDETGAIAPDVPRYSDIDDGLDAHANRIATLVSAAAVREGAASDTFHAILEISSGSEQVVGNKAAAQLMAREFPCTLVELPLDRSALHDIRRFMRPEPRKAQDRIILTSVETGLELRACLALIQRPNDHEGRVVVSLSYIDWSETLIERLRDAFGLTASESEVLEGYLANLKPKDIAARRMRALETVKVQSKSILRKTGCSRISDVVQLCASIAFLLRQLPQANRVRPAEAWVTPRDGLHTLNVAEGRQLAWYRVGAGRRPVLFVHGYLQGPFFTEDFERWLTDADISLIAPSRPGFGYTCPSQSRKGFEKTVVEDALALVDSLSLDSVGLCIHQGGASHGFRIARALGDRAKRLLLIGGGIPIDEDRHLSHMDRQTRFAAIASRHAPSVMRMVMSVGLPVYRMRGPRAFLMTQFANAPTDLATLSDPRLFEVQALGLYHAVEQGGEAWVRDGASAMADWSDDLDSVSVPQVWLNAGDDPVISAEQVTQHLEERPNTVSRILAGYGTNILHTAADEILAELVRRA